MQIFEFELIDRTVTAPEATIAPTLASTRAAGRERLLEHEGLTQILGDAAGYKRVVQAILEDAAVGVEIAGCVW